MDEMHKGGLQKIQSNRKVLGGWGKLSLSEKLWWAPENC